MTQDQSVTSKEFFTEKELTSFLKGKDTSDFKTHLTTYAEYDGLVTQVISAEESVEHLLKLKELDQKAIEHIKAILNTFCSSKPEVQSLPENPTFEEVILDATCIPKSDAQSLPENPTFEEAITFFDIPSNRKKVRNQLTTAKSINQNDEVYSSRAFNSFEKMLLSFDKNEPIKLAHNTLDIYLNDNDSWVADIVHSYKGASDLTKTVNVSGVVRLLEAENNPNNTANVYMETCSVPELIGQTVQTQKIIPMSAHLYNRQESIIKASELSIKTTQVATGSEHFSVDRKLLIDLIISLSYLVKSSSLSDSPRSRAKHIIDTFDGLDNRNQDYFVPRLSTFIKYLKNEVKAEVTPLARTNYLLTISSLVHIITIEQKIDHNSKVNQTIDRVAELFKSKRIVPLATKEEFLHYFVEKTELRPRGY
ncbi:MAG: hypothetical protein RPS47_04010 [Colwellia sp.]|jgi:hypothetical protein